MLISGKFLYEAMDIEAYLYSDAFRAKRISEDQLRLLLRGLLTQTENILECLDLPDKSLFESMVVEATLKVKRSILSIL